MILMFIFKGQCSILSQILVHTRTLAAYVNMSRKTTRIHDSDFELILSLYQLGPQIPRTKIKLTQQIQRVQPPVAFILGQVALLWPLVSALCWTFLHANGLKFPLAYLSLSLCVLDCSTSPPPVAYLLLRHCRWVHCSILTHTERNANDSLRLIQIKMVVTVTEVSPSLLPPVFLLLPICKLYSYQKK